MKRVIDRIFIGQAVENALEGQDGGRGSGNFGHKGRPGLRGGSGKGGGSQYKGAAFKHASAKQLEDIMWNKESDAAMGVNKWKKYETVWSRGEWMKENGYVPNTAKAGAAYNHYSWKGDGMMNWLLRGGGIISEYKHNIPDYRANIAKTKEEIDTITNDIASHKIKRPISVNRGFTTVAGAIACLGLNISENDFLKRLKEDKDFADGLVGYTFRDNGFMSTSIGNGFNGRVKLEINCPEGTQGTYMEEYSHFKGGGEQEFLLQRGTQLAITGYRVDNGDVVLETTVISQEPQPVPDDYFESKPKEVPSKYGVKPKKPEKPKPAPKPTPKPEQKEPPKQPETPKPSPESGDKPTVYTSSNNLSKYFPNLNYASLDSINKLKTQITKLKVGGYKDQNAALNDISTAACTQLMLHQLVGNLTMDEFETAYQYIFNGTKNEEWADAFAQKYTAKANTYAADGEAKYDEQIKGTSYEKYIKQAFPNAPKRVLYFGWQLSNSSSPMYQKALKGVMDLWKNAYYDDDEDGWPNGWPKTGN